MIGRKDIKKLAEMARIKVPQDEIEGLQKDMDSILGYIGQLGDVSAGEPDEKSRIGAVRNVVRDDSNPHESGIHTEDLVAAAPSRDGNYFKVKKILGGSDNA